MSFASLFVWIALTLVLPMFSAGLDDKNLNSTTPRINFAITDSNGHDVTSSFKVMLYNDSKSQDTNKLNDRQTIVTRMVNTCGDREGIFVDSSCAHKNLVEGSLQAYTYRCLSYVGEPGIMGYSQRVILPFHGECDQDELCVNGRGPSELRGREADVALCITSTAYVDVTNDPEQLDDAMGDVRMDATLSASDKKTPLEAESIDLESRISAFGGAKGATQSKSCIDCMDLTTDTLRSKTDFLDAEVKLASAGAAAAGILWLTLLTG